MKIRKSILNDSEEPEKTYYVEIGFAFSMVVMLLLLELMHLFSTHPDYTITNVEMLTPLEMGKVKDMAQASLQKPSAPPVVITSPTISLVDDIAKKVMDTPVDKAKESESKVKSDSTDTRLSGTGTDKQAEADVEDPMPFQIIEVPPTFPGGQEALTKYLADNTKYPAKAKDAGILGVVTISFIVEKDGSISHVEVYRGIGGGCNEEAIRVVSMMPKWIPGRQHDKPARVQFHIPLKFLLFPK